MVVEKGSEFLQEYAIPESDPEDITFDPDKYNAAINGMVYFVYPTSAKKISSAESSKHFENIMHGSNDLQDAMEHDEWFVQTPETVNELAFAPRLQPKELGRQQRKLTLFARNFLRKNYGLIENKLDDPDYSKSVASFATLANFYYQEQADTKGDEEHVMETVYPHYDAIKRGINDPKWRYRYLPALQLFVNAEYLQEKKKAMDDEKPDPSRTDELLDTTIMAVLMAESPEDKEELATICNEQFSNIDKIISIAVASWLKAVETPFSFEDVLGYVDAWAQSNSEGIWEAIHANMKAMYRLEKEHSGICLNLTEKYGIRNFARYPQELLVEQYLAAGQPEKNRMGKPFGIYVLPENDNNGTYYSYEQYMRDFAKELAEQNISLKFIEAGGNMDFYKRVSAINQDYGQMQFVGVMAHGDKRGLTLSVDGRWIQGSMRTDAVNSESAFLGKALVNIKKYLVDNAPIILHSCKGGVPKGLAQKLSFKLDTRVFGLTEDSYIDAIKTKKTRLGLDFQFKTRSPDELAMYDKGKKIR
jgi:hypothetical protein